MSPMDATILPLTAERWPAFEDLFGKQGACYGCWCVHFRLPPAARRESDREANKAFIKRRIEAGPPPGLLAFDGERAVGWMQIGPRADVPEWNNTGRASAPVDVDPADTAVWAISCFFGSAPVSKIHAWPAGCSRWRLRCTCSSP